MLTNLLKSLEGAGQKTIVSKYPDGSRVLIMPHGGRVLGLFGSSTTENFFWTNPALDEPISAKNLFEGEAWHNSGGDRTWLAPELDFFFPRFPNVGFYRPPRELDPGNYFVTELAGRLILRNRLALTAARSNRKVELQISKSLGPAPNPLRNSRMEADQSIEYAGYTLSTSLEFTNPILDESPQVGIWNLLQMPIGGELLVATYTCCMPTVYVGEIDLKKLVLRDHLCRFEMCGPGVKKLGFNAVCTTGRVGYLYQTGPQHALLVRNFFVNPSGEYVDVPRNHPSKKGDAVQACAVCNNLGQFSELEYHVAAIGSGTGRIHCEDISQVWGFRGPSEQIRRIAGRLLSSI